MSCSVKIFKAFKTTSFPFEHHQNCHRGPFYQARIHNNLLEINKFILYQLHLVIFLSRIASGRTSAVKSEDNDGLQKVAENITALDKKMVI